MPRTTPPASAEYVSVTTSGNSSASFSMFSRVRSGVAVPIFSIFDLVPSTQSKAKISSRSPVVLRTYLKRISATNRCTNSIEAPLPALWMSALIVK